MGEKSSAIRRARHKLRVIQAKRRGQDKAGISEYIRETTASVRRPMSQRQLAFRMLAVYALLAAMLLIAAGLI